MPGGSVGKDNAPLDGFNIWKTISNNDPSPRTEILVNIDLPSNGSASHDYEGIALRMGHMKLMLKVPNCTWYVPPELGFNTLSDSTSHKVRALERESLLIMGTGVIVLHFRG